MPKPDNRRFMRYETLTTVLWLTLDTSWLYAWPHVANIVAVLVTITAIMAALHSERNLRETAIAGGILAWVVTCAFWVIGDLNTIPWAVNVAKICMASVFLCLFTAGGASDTGKDFFRSLNKKFQRVKH